MQFHQVFEHARHTGIHHQVFILLWNRGPFVLFGPGRSGQRVGNKLPEGLILTAPLIQAPEFRSRFNNVDELIDLLLFQKSKMVLNAMPQIQFVEQIGPAGTTRTLAFGIVVQLESAGGYIQKLIVKVAGVK